MYENREGGGAEGKMVHQRPLVRGRVYGGSGGNRFQPVCLLHTQAFGTQVLGVTLAWGRLSQHGGQVPIGGCLLEVTQSHSVEGLLSDSSGLPGVVFSSILCIRGLLQ